MKTNLLKVSVRQNAIYISQDAISERVVSATTLGFLTNIKKLGYTFSEELLHKIDNISPKEKLIIFDYLKEITGSKLNWAPLVKGWDVPTGESKLDHVITFFANLFKSNEGSRLQCGHIIPPNTFPLERYNGCPFCGTPFHFGEIENYGQSSKLKVLELWNDDNINQYFKNLLESKTALDATQVDSLKILIKEFELPEVTITMKETKMLVIDGLVEKGEAEKAQAYFTSPNDVLRYLWYKKTGFLQLVEPRTIVKRQSRNHVHITLSLDNSEKAKVSQKEALKLKYTRSQCRYVATWINNLEINSQQAGEMMHPKRGMWVRFIRALRLAEYAQKEGFGKLKELMDTFYNQTYEVWQGEVDRNKLKMNAQETFALLKQRPGLFARSLFANMLWFGPDETLSAFSEIVDKLPGRLIFTLNMYAPIYFERSQTRIVKPLGSTSMEIGPNPLLEIYTNEQLKEMVGKVEDLCLNVISKRFANTPTPSKTMYIDPMLFNVPLAIGDRSETIQDASCALMGTRFPIEGNTVRLFMQWGKGLPAQHLDMDLSCQIAYEQSTEACSFFHLVATGAKHSGDIRSIPNKIGTAEYIELNLEELSKANAEYVTFTCNAYSNGALSPNLVVGWMNSAYPMTISEKTGVAYDPSCVQHQVRISQSLTKGLVFGVLDVSSKEIIWLEMPFEGQTVANMSVHGVNAMLNKLKCKTTIGNLLSIKASAQHIQLVDTPNADEVYSIAWAINTAAVTQLLID